MYYLIYKITNVTNGKLYIGAHKTHDIDDGYMGSGKILKRAIEKYGLENFTKDILVLSESQSEMYSKEAEIVNEEWVNDPNTYNLKLGGEGGFDHIHSNSEIQRENWKKAIDKIKYLRGNDPAWVAKKSVNLSIAGKKSHAEGNRPDPPNWAGKNHTDETKCKISEAKKGTFTGNENSQYGTRWVFSIEEKRSCKMKKGEATPDGWYDGYKLDFEGIECFEDIERVRKEKYRAWRESRTGEKAYSSEERQQMSIDKARLLYDQYIISGLSIRKFAETDVCDVGYAQAAKLFRKYIPEYEGKKK